MTTTRQRGYPNNVASLLRDGRGLSLNGVILSGVHTDIPVLGVPVNNTGGIAALYTVPAGYMATLGGIQSANSTVSNRIVSIYYTTTAGATPALADRLVQFTSTASVITAPSSGGVFDEGGTLWAQADGDSAITLNVGINLVTKPTDGITPIYAHAMSSGDNLLVTGIPAGSWARNASARWIHNPTAGSITITSKITRGGVQTTTTAPVAVPGNGAANVIAPVGLRAGDDWNLNASGAGLNYWDAWQVLPIV